MTRVTEIVAWTRAYNPFVMGGNCHYLLASRLPCEGPVDVGEGFRVVLIHGPEGQTRVAELSTGAIVGETLEEVRADIAACTDKAMMQKQVADAAALKARKGVKQVQAREFWGYFEKGRGKK